MNSHVTETNDPAKTSGGSIYRELEKHQRNEDWAARNLLSELQAWTKRYNVCFKLDVSDVALCVDPLPVSVLGHFRIGHNGFGLKGEIAINTIYLNELPRWQVLGVLLHELLHAWQHVHGKPSPHNHHNLEFRGKAAQLGLLVDRHGVTDYLLDSPFADLLRAQGVHVPTEADEETADGERRIYGVHRKTHRPKGKSTLIKWSCGCTNVRTGTSDLEAHCMKCGNQFSRAS